VKVKTGGMGSLNVQPEFAAGGSGLEAAAGK